MVEKVRPESAAATGGSGPLKKIKGPAAGSNHGALTFGDVLKDVRRRQGVCFSAHALQRMEKRRIQLSEHDLARIAEAMNKAAAKGARSTLLLYGEIAFVASIANRTIITAVDSAAERESIFTGIDSAVIF